ncbi:hypothetical protein EAO77_06045 [Streptomyces sp. t39]|nr:hypothetical protein EAO77_06045 [Streptomyces sp. t39]
MTAPAHLRLLPWTGPEGKPCYLSTDDRRSFMSRLADNIESIQLGIAVNLLEQATEVLNDAHAEPGDLHRLAHELAGALTEILRVAVSRGHILATNRPDGS